MNRGGIDLCAVWEMLVEIVASFCYSQRPCMGSGEDVV